MNGQRTRLGLEGFWQGRRVTLKGEWLQMTDSACCSPSPPRISPISFIRGYYLTGVVRVFGESGRNGQAVDLAARFDRMTLGSANSSDEPFTNPRADHIAPLAKDTWTFGGNWQLHRWIRIQGNLIREALVDSARRA